MKLLLLPEWEQDQHLSEPEHMSSHRLFFLLNWALALVSPCLTLTLCDLTLLVLSWLCQQWNLRLIYETKNCIHSSSKRNIVPTPKRHSGPSECRIFAAVHGGWRFKLESHKCSNFCLECQWARVKYSNENIFILAAFILSFLHIS